MVGAEHKPLGQRGGQPIVAGDLGLKLPRPPAGIAQRQQGLSGPLAARQRLQDVQRRCHLQSAGDLHRALGPGAPPVGRMQHKPAPAFHRAAEMHTDVPPPGRDGDLQMLQEAAETQLFQRFVHDQAHGAIVGMGADQHHAAVEARVGHAGHGDQDLAGKLHRAGPFAGRLAGSMDRGPPPLKPHAGRGGSVSRAVAAK